MNRLTASGNRIDNIKLVNDFCQIKLEFHDNLDNNSDIDNEERGRVGVLGRVYIFATGSDQGNHWLQNILYKAYIDYVLEGNDWEASDLEQHGFPTWKINDTI